MVISHIGSKRGVFLVSAIILLLAGGSAYSQYGPFYSEQRNLKSFSFYDSYIDVITNYNHHKQSEAAIAKLDSFAQLSINQNDYLQYLFLKNEVSNFYKFDNRYDKGATDLHGAMLTYALNADTLHIEYAVSLRLLRGLVVRTSLDLRGVREMLDSQLEIIDQLGLKGEPLTNTLVDYGLHLNREGEKDRALDLLYRARSMALEDNDLMSFAIADYSIISNLDRLDMEETTIEVLKNDLMLLKQAQVNVPTLVYMSFFNYILGNRHYWNLNDIEASIRYNLNAAECIDTLRYPLWNLKSSVHSLLALCYSDLNDTASFWQHYRTAYSVAIEGPMSDYNRGLAFITLVEAALDMEVDTAQQALDVLQEHSEAAKHFKEKMVSCQAEIHLRRGDVPHAISTITNEAESVKSIVGIEVPLFSDSLNPQVQLAYLDILNRAYPKLDGADGGNQLRGVLHSLILRQNNLYLKIIEREVYGHEVSSILADYTAFSDASLSYILDVPEENIDMELAINLFFSSKALQLNNSLGKGLLQSQIEDDSLQYSSLLQAVSRVQIVKTELVSQNLSTQGRDSLQRELNAALIESLMLRYRLSRGVDLDFQSIYIPTLAQVQSKLDERQGILEFCNNDTTLHWLLITRDDVKLGRKKFDNLNAAISKEIFNVKTGGVQSELGSLILSGELEGELMLLDRLTIVPSNLLSLIPFEWLKMPSTSKKLIETHTISYNYSTSLWYNTSTYSKVDSIASILAVAPIFNHLPEPPAFQQFQAYNDRGQSLLSPLSSSKDEVEEIGRLFESTNTNSLLLVGENATESMLSEHLKNFDIIHFATHGLVNRAKPERSGIYLHPSSSSDNENFLSLGRLYNLQLNADLVVLSACNTGTGAIADGEGVMALPRGFILAGVPNVIATLWRVSDERTKDFMILFYKHLLNNNTYADALQLAKLDSIKQGFLPLDWAGFILIGN